MSALLEEPMSKKKDHSIRMEPPSRPDAKTDGVDLAAISALVERLRTDRMNYDGGRDSQVVVDKPLGDLLQGVVNLLRELTGFRLLAANKVLKIAATQWLEETLAGLEALKERRRLEGQ